MTDLIKDKQDKNKIQVIVDHVKEVKIHAHDEINDVEKRDIFDNAVPFNCNSK